MTQQQSDDDLPARVAKQVRLWVLAIICAAIGAYGDWVHNSFWVACWYFLGALIIFGIPLWFYERHRNNRS